MRSVVLLTSLLATAVAAQGPDALPINGHPFAALPVVDGLIVSISTNGRPGSASGLRVYRGAPDRSAAVCLQPIPSARVMGLAATPGGRGLVVAAGDAGLVLLDRAAVQGGCRATPVAVPMGARGAKVGTLDVVLSADGRFAYVANEYGVAASDAAGQDIRGHVAVVELAYDAAGVPVGGKVVARIATGAAAVTGLALSPDGRRLYVTSEVARPGARVGNAGGAALAHGGCRQGDRPAQPYGLVSVIDTAKAQAGARDALVGSVAAGCSPVRLALTPDGQTLWVTARGDDRVLAFAAVRLERDPEHALLGMAPSGGKAPVGLALYDGGRRLAVANSDRFAGPAATGNMALLDATPAAPRVTGTAPATYFPRSISVSVDGRTLFLTDYNGGQVQVVPAR